MCIHQNHLRHMVNGNSYHFLESANLNCTILDMVGLFLYADASLSLFIHSKPPHLYQFLHSARRSKMLCKHFTAHSMDFLWLTSRKSLVEDDCAKFLSKKSIVFPVQASVLTASKHIANSQYFSELRGAARVCMCISLQEQCILGCVFAAR